MIAYLDIEVHAENPQIPLGPCVAFVGSPSNVRILNVPNGIGSWKIDAVAVAFTRPDNSITTVNAVNVAGCWVATLPASDVGGRCDKGFQIEASGIDENGNAVTGYVLGVGDVVILPRDGTAVSDGVQYYFHYRDAVPTTPRKGDVCVISGVLKWYDGTAWQTFAAGGSGVEVVPPSTDPADAGKAADAKATGDALAGKRGLTDMAVYTTTDTWAWAGEDATVVAAMTSAHTYAEWDDSLGWVLYDLPENYNQTNYPVDSGATTIVFEVDTGISLEPVTGTRSSSVAPVTGDALAKTSQLPTAPADIGAATAAQGAKADTAVQPFTSWTIKRNNVDITAQVGQPRWNADYGGWDITACYVDGERGPDFATGGEDATEISWTEQESIGSYVATRRASIPAASDATPQMDGMAAAGSSAAFARGDHVHPKDTSKQDAISDLAAIRTGATAGATAVQPAALAGAVRYDLVQTITLGQLLDRVVQKVVLNAASTTLVLPALTDLSGKVSDFGIDMINAYEESDEPAAATFQLDGTLGTDYNLIVPKGETWSDMTALAAGEMAVYYFTRSAFQNGDVPTWEVVKKVVEFVPVPSAP